MITPRQGSLQKGRTLIGIIKGILNIQIVEITAELIALRDLMSRIATREKSKKKTRILRYQTYKRSIVRTIAKSITIGGRLLIIVIRKIYKTLRCQTPIIQIRAESKATSRIAIQKIQKTLRRQTTLTQIRAKLKAILRVAIQKIYKFLRSRTSITQIGVESKAILRVAIQKIYKALES